jgi:integrase
MSLLQHLPDYLKPVIQTAYITGWRIQSEILTRQKHNVDLDAGWLRLEPGEGKDGEGRNFPLIPGLREVLALQLEQTRVLEQQSDQIIPWLFHKNGKRILSFRKAWCTTCKKAGLAGRIPHDFRRTAVRTTSNAQAFLALRLWQWSAIAPNQYIAGMRSRTKQCSERAPSS